MTAALAKFSRRPAEQRRLLVRAVVMLALMRVAVRQVDPGLLVWLRTTPAALFVSCASDSPRAERGAEFIVVPA